MARHYDNEDAGDAHAMGAADASEFFGDGGRFQVQVGNIGTVYDGNSESDTGQSRSTRKGC